MIIKTRTNIYQTSYHLVFVTKYRKEIFDTSEKQTFLKDIFQTIAQEHEITILTQEVMPDHVHLLVSFPPKYSISDVVKKLKGASARHWFIQYPESKELLWKGHLWHSSYFVNTIGNVSTNIVSDYLKNQKNQPPQS